MKRFFFGLATFVDVVELFFGERKNRVPIKWAGEPKCIEEGLAVIQREQGGVLHLHIAWTGGGEVYSQRWCLSDLRRKLARAVQVGKAARPWGCRWSLTELPSPPRV